MCNKGGCQHRCYFLSCRAHQEKTRRMVLRKEIACQAIHPLGHQPSRLTALASHQSRRLHQQAHQVQLSLKQVSLNLQRYSTIVMLDFLGDAAYEQTWYTMFFLL